MIKKLDLYMVREHVGPFVGGLLTLTILMLLNRIFQLLDLIIKKGVPIATVFQVFMLSLPFILAMTVPMALLISSLVAFGRFSQDFEILAAKSLGISFRRVLFGPIAFGTIIAVLMVLFNNYVLPDANHKVKNLVFDISLKKPAIRIKEGVFTKINNYHIYVESKDDRTGRIYNVKIEQPQGDGKITTITSKNGIVDIKDSFLILTLYNGTIYQTEGKSNQEFRAIHFQRHAISIPVDTRLVKKERAYRGEREMNIAQLEAKIKEKDKEIKSTNDTFRIKILTHIKDRYRIEIHKKFSLPFAGIIFIIVGAAISTITRRGGYGSAFGFSFLIYTFYYIMLIGGEELGRRGYVSPFISMWGANIIFSLIAILLARRCDR